MQQNSIQLYPAAADDCCVRSRPGLGVGRNPGEENGNYGDCRDYIWVVLG